MMFIQYKILFILCSLRHIILCDDIEIDLTSYNFQTNKTEFIEYANITEDNTRILVTNIDQSVEFFIIQVHSYVKVLTLSYTPTIQLQSHVNGTNIGLYWDRSVGLENDIGGVSFYCIHNMSSGESLKILLAIHVYGKNDPIPGGCNLSFETMIAPYQKISYTDSTIEVASQPPSRRKSSCNKNDRVQVDMYHMFLSENDPNETNYFTGIANMMTVERIKKNGRRVHKTDYAKYKILYNLYRGTGEIFAVIATDVGGSSAYVPAASFGCDLSKWDADCAGPGKIVCMGLLLFGFVMCIAGHRLFKMSLFVLGFGLGQLVGSIFVNSGVLVTVFSILSGAIWVFLWITLGVPLLSISLTFFFASTILISTVFYLGFAVNDLFGNDLVFWTTYACVFLSILLISSAFAPRSHILALSLIGSYCAIVAINYHSGGNLQYIFINTVRRMNVAGFNRVIVDPPIQVKDIQHIATWIALFSLGYFVQSRWQRGAPPFPSTEYRMLRS